MPKKKSPVGKIYNEKTKRYVLRTGVVGKSILAKQKMKRESVNPANFESIPNEIIREILLELDSKDLKSACSTNKRIRMICNDPGFQTKYKELHPKKIPMVNLKGKLVPQPAVGDEVFVEGYKFSVWFVKKQTGIVHYLHIEEYEEGEEGTRDTAELILNMQQGKWEFFGTGDTYGFIKRKPKNIRFVRP
uniref:F-box-like family protein n=1 Tax=Marseillevirus LCMAC102 TaxID=2506603 RepID=A0A481YUA8_9VIRU|nr:MAG: F-box-like family protein [Marseillevirus LCMAC102]